MNQEERDILIEVRGDTKWLKDAFTTHLSEHFRVRILAVGSLIAAITALLITLLNPVSPMN